MRTELFMYFCIINSVEIKDEVYRQLKCYTHPLSWVVYVSGGSNMAGSMFFF